MLIQYSGAYNNMYLAKNNEIIEIKADRMPVGTYSGEDRPFRTNSIRTARNEMIYLMTDGFADQFGGPLNKKFMSGQFRKLISEIQHLSMRQQEDTHRKLYLPTYGLFQEGRFFGEGKRLDLARLPSVDFGLLICEDLWHSDPARRLARGGAKLVAVVSASPGRLGPGPLPESQTDWESLTRSTALLNTCWVLYCGRVGWEEGSFYTGGSHIVRPGGELLARAPFLEEHLLVADLDLRAVDRLRWRLPLLRAERTDIEGPG